MRGRAPQSTGDIFYSRRIFRNSYLYLVLSLSFIMSNQPIITFNGWLHPLNELYIYYFYYDLYPISQIYICYICYRLLHPMRQVYINYVCYQ